jgi:polysaccharide deacetylase 2 family uncharacterized protein YibQ
MASDDLNRPLGMATPSRRPSRRGFVTITVGCIASAAVIGIAAVLVFANPHGGEPFAVATIPPPKPLPPAADSASTASIRPPPRRDGNGDGVLENGVTVFRATHPQNAAASSQGTGPLVIKVPQALGLSEVAAVDKHLIEASRYGPLPKIAADGSRASEIYARPPVFGTALPAGAPRIAIYIGGLGLNAAATTDAIELMPAAVSLAFAPYGEKLDDAVSRAKAAGHEVLLQLPMEAFGDDRPGPHMLRTGATQSETIDDLHWLMSRMSGYVGMTNFLGGRFTADQTAMTTMLQELAGRGLLYVEDGTSRRSLGPTLAPSLGIPTARADVVLDVAPDASGLRAALVKLEAVARDKGSAIGEASDLPAHLAAIAAFAQTLQAKGIALVPVSALASATAPAMAATP